MNQKKITESDFKSNLPVWLRSKGNLLQTSIFLHRNLSGFKFPSKASKEERRQVCSKILAKIYKGTLSDTFKYKHVSDMSPLLKGIIYERGISTAPLDPDIDESIAILINKDETISIVINDDDHLVVKVSSLDMDFNKNYEVAKNIIESIDLNYAQNNTFGYLTSSPAIMGLGCRVEATIHLPTFASLSNNQDFIANLNFFKMTDLFGTSTEVFGNIFNVSLKNTYYAKDVDILFKSFSNSISSLLSTELLNRKEIQELDKKDIVWKTYGSLKYSYVLDFVEAMGSLSLLKMGIEEEILKDNFGIEKLICCCFPTHLQFLSKCKVDEVDEVRAKIIRKYLK